jgi:hypothetical protein
MCARVRSRIYQLQKLGNRPDENEDVAAVAEPPDALLCRGPARYAVADGATTGAFSREWAAALVHIAVAHWAPGERLHATAEPLRAEWAGRFAALQIPWYAEAKARAGSFATLLALELAPPAEGTTEGVWHAAAVGDTCLFQLRDDALCAAFPLASSSAFDSTPDLLASKPRPGDPAEERQARGQWRPGDRFYLMSDALAAWFLAACERGELPWAEVGAWQVRDDARCFEEWIAGLRGDRRLRNDDVTLLLIEILDDDNQTATT